MSLFSKHPLASLALCLLAPAATLSAPAAAGARPAHPSRPHRNRGHQVHGRVHRARPAHHSPAPRPSTPAVSPATGSAALTPIATTTPIGPLAPTPTAPTPAPTTSPIGTSAKTWADMAEPRLLAPDSVWNTPLATDTPLDPSSGGLSASVANMVATYGQGFNVVNWSIPIYIVPTAQPTVTMHLNPNPSTGRVNPGLQAAFNAVPVPADAKPSTGTDNVMVIYQPSTDTMWETAKTQLQSDGWHFNYGGRMIHFSQNPGYYQQIPGADGSQIEEPYWGNSASGLPVADSVVTFRDLANGYIDHALGILLPHNWVRAGVKAWPAARTDGVSTDPNSVPEGGRFRLDPNLDISNLPPLTRMIALAAQKYGLIVRDGSANVSIDGQVPESPAQNAAWQQALTSSGFQYYSQVLKSFPWSHLQLTQMSLSPFGS